MEEKIAQQQRQQRSKTPATTTTTAISSSSRSQEVVSGLGSGGGDSATSTIMGRTRSGSYSNSVGWMEEGGSSSTSSSVTKTPTTPRHHSKRDSGYLTDYSPAPFSPLPHFTFETPDSLLQGLGGSSPSPGGSSSSSGVPLPRSSAQALNQNPGSGWQPRRVLPDLDSDDEGDDDAFASDNVTVGATSELPGSRPVTFTPTSTSMERSALILTRRRQTRSESADERDGHGDDNDDNDNQRFGAAERLTFQSRRSTSVGTSPRNVQFRGAVRQQAAMEEDSDDDQEEEEDWAVACTDYHLAPPTLVSLPGGGELARTIATQTPPHRHCQLIDHILDCPQEFPQLARGGNTVRRLRYYSEGEESVNLSSLSHGPLPDIVPVTHAHRERSLSAPDLEAMQRQRAAAREVGRELRRISDEFVRRHEELHENRGGGAANPDGALAALHAELNGVAAFFLTGVRRFIYRSFAGYFRHVFHWTRQAMAAADQPPGSCVDDDPR